MTLASQFIAEFGTNPLSDDRGIRAMAWMATHDPHGGGELDQPNAVVNFTFTDGSKLKLDLLRHAFAGIN